MIPFSRIREHVDRTQIVFYTAGLLVLFVITKLQLIQFFQFALGVWAYFYGATSKTSDETYQYDALSLLPGFLAFLCFLT